MALVYVLRYFPTLTETFVYREAAEVAARGLPLGLVALGARADGAALTDAPPWTPLRPTPGGLLHAVEGAAGREALRALQGRQGLKRALRAAALVGGLGPEDALHAHFAGEGAEWAQALAAASGLPYGVTVHAVDLFRPRPSLEAVLRGAAVVLTVSRYNAEALERRYGVRAQVVRCGVNPERWAAARPEGDGPAVSVGRFVPKKGLDLLIRAVPQVPGLRARLATDAPADLASPAVELLGLRPTPEIVALYQSASMFVLPCRVAPDGDRDGVPVAMMEAMAAGLPVVTTSLPGLEELVDERTAWIVPPDDEAALVEALRDAWGHPEERRRRGEAGRARVLEGFTVAGQAEGLLRAWAEVGWGPAAEALRVHPGGR
ncbi:glycosyltransferase family 4 protein [Myxococcota bacterium]|nr:glycosyltransferase family 4 protein [Myxococcota bacterium]